MSSKGKNKNYTYKEQLAESKLRAEQKTTKRENRYPVKKKLLLTILLSLAAPLTVFVFTPFDMYGGSVKDFAFSLGDFLPLCVLFAFIAAAVIFAVLMLLRNTAYEIGCGVVGWISVMFVLQRLFLNFDVNSLPGDGVGKSAPDTWMIVVDLLIWIAVGVGIVCAIIFLRHKHMEMITTVMVIAMVTVVGMQTVSFAVASFTSDVYTPVLERDSEISEDKAHVPEKLTFDNFETLSGKNNVVVFIVDRFDVRYYDKMQKANPEFFECLDGFTYYNDYTSIYGRTYPSVVNILTGKDNDPWEKRKEYFKDAYLDGGYVKDLHDAGYDINVYTKSYYAYDDAYYMSAYVDNTSKIKGYSIDNKWSLAWDMSRLSLWTLLPFEAKEWVGMLSTPLFNDHVKYAASGEVYSSDLKDLTEYVNDAEFAKVTSKGKFTFIHLDGCHIPNKYGENWGEPTDQEKNDTNLALEQNFAIINKYIEEMKRLGVYDDATIVITGDHSAAISDTKLLEDTSGTKTRVTAMLFKKSGDAGTPLATSTAQISQDNLWASIFESEGLDSLKKCESFFDIPEGEDRERRYIFEQSKSDANGLSEDRLVIYKITGTANDADNWEIVDYVGVGGKIHD